MERTRDVPSLRKTAAILCFAAVAAFLVVMWFDSYTRFNFVCGPLPFSREFQINLSDGRIDAAILPSDTATEWRWHTLTLSQFEQDPVVKTLTKRYRTMLRMLEHQKRIADQKQSELAGDLNAQMERGYRDFEELREELKQDLLRNGPFFTKTVSAMSMVSTAMPPPTRKTLFGLSFQASPSGIKLVVPIYLLILASGAAAVLFSQRRHVRFSLRTMLIAVTLTAIMFGVFAVLTR